MKSKEQYVFDFYRSRPKASFWEAYDFSNEVHKKHTRKDEAKYIVHPLEGVYTEIILGIKDEIDHIEMMMHDTIEESRDHGDKIVTPKMIRDKFGLVVARDIVAVTKKRGLDVRGLVEYFRKMEKEPRRVNLKMVDRYINIRRRWFDVFPKQKIGEYAYETIYYILPMSERVITLAESEHKFPRKSEYVKYASALRVLRGAIKGILRGAEHDILITCKV